MNEIGAYWGQEVVLKGLWAHKQVSLGYQAPNSLGFEQIGENLADEAQKAGEHGC